MDKPETHQQKLHTLAATLHQLGDSPSKMQRRRLSQSLLEILADDPTTFQQMSEQPFSPNAHQPKQKRRRNRKRNRKRFSKEGRFNQNNQQPIKFKDKSTNFDFASPCWPMSSSFKFQNQRATAGRLRDPSVHQTTFPEHEEATMVQKARSIPSEPNAYRSSLTAGHLQLPVSQLLPRVCSFASFQPFSYGPIREQTQSSENNQNAQFAESSKQPLPTTVHLGQPQPALQSNPSQRDFGFSLDQSKSAPMPLMFPGNPHIASQYQMQGLPVSFCCSPLPLESAQIKVESDATLGKQGKPSNHNSQKSLQSVYLQQPQTVTVASHFAPKQSNHSSVVIDAGPKEQKQSNAQIQPGVGSILKKSSHFGAPCIIEEVESPMDLINEIENPKLPSRKRARRIRKKNRKRHRIRTKGAFKNILGLSAQISDLPASLPNSAANPETIAQNNKQLAQKPISAQETQVIAKDFGSSICAPQENKVKLMESESDQKDHGKQSNLSASRTSQDNHQRPLVEQSMRKSSFDKKSSDQPLIQRGNSGLSHSKSAVSETPKKNQKSSHLQVGKFSLFGATCFCGSSAAQQNCNCATSTSIETAVNHNWSRHGDVRQTPTAHLDDLFLNPLPMAHILGPTTQSGQPAANQKKIPTSSQQPHTSRDDTTLTYTNSVAAPNLLHNPLVLSKKDFSINLGFRLVDMTKEDPTPRAKASQE